MVSPRTSWLQIRRAREALVISLSLEGYFWRCSCGKAVCQWMDHTFLGHGLKEIALRMYWAHLKGSHEVKRPIPHGRKVGRRRADVMHPRA